MALDIVELRYPHGVVITTSGLQKFYSNGLDLEHANWTPYFFRDSLYALWRRLLVYVDALFHLVFCSVLTRAAIQCRPLLC